MEILLVKLLVEDLLIPTAGFPGIGSLFGYTACLIPPDGILDGYGNVDFNPYGRRLSMG